MIQLNGKGMNKLHLAKSVLRDLTPPILWRALRKLRTAPASGKHRSSRLGSLEYDALYRVGGKNAVTAMRDGFFKANLYKKWDDWSLTHQSILWIAELVIKEKVQRIVEFGAGYSTVALAEFLRQVSGSRARMDSFEHQTDFAKRILKYLPEDAGVTLHCVDLLQVKDEVFERLFDAPDPYGDFVASAVLVPKNRYHETRIRNVFYGFDFSHLGT